ncbi:MAG: magnesium transporter [Planctomycetota bacterium]|jgi:magnesium transporter
MDEKLPDIEDLKGLLEGGDDALTQFCADVHFADIAEWLQDLSEDEAWRVFSVLTAEDRAEIFEYSEEPVRELLVGRMSDNDFVEVLHEMQADDVADLLALTNEATAERVLRKIDFDRAQGLRELIHYQPDTAGGLMTTEFVTVPEGTRIGDAIKEIKKQVQTDEGPSGEDGLGIWVVDDAGCPVGFASDRDLLSHSIHDSISEVMEGDIKTVAPDQDQEVVASIFRKYGMSEVPVVDRGGALIGIVAYEYAHELIEEEAEEDLLRLVGTSPDEHTRLPVLTRVKHRLPMQPLTVLGGLLSAWILDFALPEETGPGVRILTYIPLIIGLAGNVGIQSSAVLVRALATGEVTPDRERSVLFSEIAVGSVIGVLCGLAAYLGAYLIEDDLRFAFAVGSAIAVSVSWASVLGSGITLLCNRLKIDPAIVAGPFLITVSDVSGSAIFVTVASLLITAA